MSRRGGKHGLSLSPTANPANRGELLLTHSSLDWHSERGRDQDNPETTTPDGFLDPLVSSFPMLHARKPRQPAFPCPAFESARESSNTFCEAHISRPLTHILPSLPQAATLSAIIVLLLFRQHPQEVPQPAWLMEMSPPSPSLP